jgi:hypothetical protein
MGNFSALVLARPRTRPLGRPRQRSSAFAPDLPAEDSGVYSNTRPADRQLGNDVVGLVIAQRPNADRAG